MIVVVNDGVLIPFDLLAHQTTALRIERLKWIVETIQQHQVVRTYDRHDEGILLEVISMVVFVKLGQISTKEGLPISISSIRGKNKIGAVSLRKRGGR